MGRAQVHTVSNLTMSRSAGIRFICRCGILTTLWRLRAHAHAPAPARRSDSITPAQWERPSAPLERAVTTQARVRCCWLGTPSDGRSSQLLYSAQLARPAAADRARPRATAATHMPVTHAASRMPGSPAAGTLELLLVSYYLVSVSLRILRTAEMPTRVARAWGWCGEVGRKGGQGALPGDRTQLPCPAVAQTMAAPLTVG